MAYKHNGVPGTPEDRTFPADPGRWRLLIADADR